LIACLEMGTWHAALRKMEFGPLFAFAQQSSLLIGLFLVAGTSPILPKLLHLRLSVPSIICLAEVTKLVLVLLFLWLYPLFFNSYHEWRGLPFEPVRRKEMLKGFALLSLVCFVFLRFLRSWSLAVWYHCCDLCDGEQFEAVCDDYLGHGDVHSPEQPIDSHGRSVVSCFHAKKDDDVPVLRARDFGDGSHHFQIVCADRIFSSYGASGQRDALERVACRFSSSFVCFGCGCDACCSFCCCCWRCGSGVRFQVVGSQTAFCCSINYVVFVWRSVESCACVGCQLGSSRARVICENKQTKAVFFLLLSFLKVC
jgi:hypothetical protein